MGLFDKFKKNKKDFSIENEDFLQDDELNTKSSNGDDEFQQDFDLENNGMSDEIKEQKQNFANMFKNNKKIAIGVGGVVGVGILGVVVEPMITSAIGTSGVMDNKEFEQTTKEIQAMAQSTIKEDEEMARIQDQERKEKIERMKADREAKKLLKEKELQANNNETNQNNNQVDNGNVLQENNNQQVNGNSSNENSSNGNSSNGNSEVANQVKNQEEMKANIEKESQERNLKLAKDKNYINENGEVVHKKIEKEMDNNFNRSVKNIEQTDFSHNTKDIMDPFVQEYDGTINSRAMRNELSENMNLMKDYIEFLETKKKFEEAKLIYEKKKQKNIFEEEINKVKQEFLVEVDGMRKSMDELKNLNAELTNKLENNGKTQELEELKKSNDELEERKMKLSIASSQKVYKIGQNYLLEETDIDGNVKIYKDGNAYKGHVIQQITPEFIKVKDEIGNSLILTVSSGEEFSGTYSKIEIPTPAKVEIENGDLDKQAKESGTKVENYSDVKNKEKIEAQKTIDEQRSKTTSRFLN